MNEHDERWDIMTKQLDKECKREWIKLVIYIVGIVLSLYIAYLIGGSNLPDWLKWWLIG